jgi:cobalt-zinc-cadmium efflux system outer membrane protein
MKVSILVLFQFLALSLYAQKDTTLTLNGTEALFLKNNYELLASRFNVDAAQAAIIQARIWENPVISVSVNAYNPEKKKFFDAGPEGQKSAGFDQLICLGGKKRNEVALAQSNAELAELEFADLMRNLKLQLRSNYFGLYYQNLSYASIDKQLSNLDTLVTAYTAQVQKGNIPMKDLVRLQSLELNLKNQRTQLYENILDFRSKLTLLTGIPLIITPAPSDAETAAYHGNKVLQADTLNHIALLNRTDLKIAQKQVESSGLNLKLQKSLAIPNITVGSNWDQQGGVFKNEVNLNVGFPLPLWNRNQGNIKIASAQLNEAAVQKDYQAASVSSEVYKSFKKWEEARENYSYFTQTNLRNLEDVHNGIYKNFRNGNLSLIEFTDFMESYHSTMLQYYQFAQNLVDACEEINYTANSKIF